MKREKWSSTLGFIIAGIGSAVGLGTMVRFSYMVGKDGGEAHQVERSEKIMNVWIKALLMTIIVIAIIKVSVYAATGLWTVGFSMQSGSMMPNMQTGDAILVQSSQRTNITTYEEGKTLNYKSFNDYGDVIAFYPRGNSKLIPIIHRAMYYVEEGNPMWPGGSPAPYAGYITKGDNNRTNPLYDQQGSISYLQPVKKEWIIAVAKAKIPLSGYLLSSIVGMVLLWAVPYVIIVGYLFRRKKIFHKCHATILFIIYFEKE